MNKLIIIFIIGFGWSFYGFGQKSLNYNPKDIHVKIPAELPDLQQDTIARKGDFLEYDVTGQEITDTAAYEITPIESTDKSSPWLVLGQLLRAYAGGNIDNIKALYTKASVNQINKVLNSSDATGRYLTLVKEIKTMHVYFAMDYDNGIIALVETNPGNVERFRFVKEKGNYMLEAYEEKNIPQVNNVMVYYTHRPLPLVRPELAQSPDSLKSDETPFITFKLKRPGDWISVFIGAPGYSVELQEKDGGLNDYDHDPGVVKMIFYGSSFPVGDLDVMAVESNYPPNQITNTMINSGLKFRIKIKE